MLSEEEKRKRIEYWENNKEILLIKERERYHNNIEKQRARSKKYRDENKEAISLRNKANPKRQQSYKIYYNTNKETVLKKCKNKYIKNREKIVIKKLNIRQRDPIKCLLSAIKTKSKQKNILYDPKIEQILKDGYDENKYCRCFNVFMQANTGYPKSNSISIDKIIPQMGYVVGNVQLICHRANTIKNCATLQDLEKLIFYLENREMFLINYFTESTSSQELIKWARLKRNDAHKRAKEKNIEFNISCEDIIKIFPMDFICPILRINMCISLKNQSQNIILNRLNFASLDRIDSMRGYTKDNIQIISNKANSIKNNATIEELKMIRDYIIKYSNKS